LVRICEVLAATPNDLLLPEGKPPAQSGRDRLLARITAATDNPSLTSRRLRLAFQPTLCPQNNPRAPRHRSNDNAADALPPP
jgi:hypothetical protein